MGSLWLPLRAGLRRRWRPVLGLAVLLGVMGGVVLTAAAGAERTHTAYPRFQQWARAAQVQLVPNGDALPARYSRRCPGSRRWLRCPRPGCTRRRSRPAAASHRPRWTPCPAPTVRWASPPTG